MKPLKLFAVLALVSAGCDAPGRTAIDEPEDFLLANIEAIADVVDRKEFGDVLEITSDPRIIALAEHPDVRSVFPVTEEMELAPGVMLYSVRPPPSYFDQEPGGAEEEEPDPDCVMEDFDRVGPFKRTSRWTGFGLCMKRTAEEKCGSPDEGG
ncbi:MAG: hypothetical protein OXI76_10130 [Gemmatimonadota bacterium]|nr:hypothetical protein [Gemmatimonadota bacterium]